MRAIGTSLATTPRGGAGPGSAHERRGFTLVEVLVSVVILGVVGVAVFGAYNTGFQTAQEQGNADVVDSLLRSRMERLLATKFNSLISGSDNVNYDGTNYNLVWTVSLVDLDDDAVDDTRAKKIVLTLLDAQLTTIVVKADDKVGKVH